MTIRHDLPTSSDASPFVSGVLIAWEHSLIILFLSPLPLSFPLLWPRNFTRQSHGEVGGLGYSLLILIWLLNIFIWMLLGKWWGGIGWILNSFVNDITIESGSVLPPWMKNCLISGYEFLWEWRQLLKEVKRRKTARERPKPKTTSAICISMIISLVSQKLEIEQSYTMILQVTHETHIYADYRESFVFRAPPLSFS